LATVSWWTRGTALLAATALLLTFGTANGARAGALCSLLAAVFAFVAYGDQAAARRSPAALAAGLCLAATALLCVPLILRTRPWLNLAGPAGQGGSLRRRLRQIALTLLGGALLGSLCAAGAGLGAYALRPERHFPAATSQTVPDNRRDVGSAGQNRAWPSKLDRVAWKGTVNGPVALSQCGRTYHRLAPYQGTLVSLEGDSVVGRRGADGRVRWRYTLRDATVQQVAVGADCHVLVLADAALISLDAYDGSVAGRVWLDDSFLSPGGTSTSLSWRFITPVDHGGAPARLVSLPASDTVHLSNSRGVIAVRRADARILAHGDSRGSDCRYLIDYGGADDPGTLLVSGCESPAMLVLLPDLPRQNILAAEEPYDVLFGPGERSVPDPPGCPDGSTLSAHTLNARGSDVLLGGVSKCWDDAGQSGGLLAYVPAQQHQDEPRHVARLATRQPLAFPPVSTSGDGVLLSAKDGLLHADRQRPGQGTKVRLGPGQTAVAAAEQYESQHATHLPQQILALTRTGRLYTLMETAAGDDASDDAGASFAMKAVGSTDLAAAACPSGGRRDLHLDRTTATALVTCTERDGTTRVTALRE
ncbi:hypothetical protein, partial [Streptomyces sp. NPDC059900]|uniref:hypothetical protein n=1 Tax=Streptomyces sp. NPDC059900 TaxID=3155816 RepID=UPI003D06A282